MKQARLDVDKVAAIDPPVSFEKLQLIANQYNTRVEMRREMGPARRRDRSLLADLRRRARASKQLISALRRVHKYSDPATIAGALDRLVTSAMERRTRRRSEWQRAVAFIVEVDIIAEALEAYDIEAEEVSKDWTAQAKARGIAGDPRPPSLERDVSNLTPMEWLIGKRLPALWKQRTRKTFKMSKVADNYIATQCTDFVIACAAALGFEQNLEGIARHYKDAQKHEKAQRMLRTTR